MARPRDFVGSISLWSYVDLQLFQIWTHYRLILSSSFASHLFLHLLPWKTWGYSWNLYLLHFILCCCVQFPCASRHCSGKSSWRFLLISIFQAMKAPELKEKLEESEKLIKELTVTWEEKLRKTEEIAQVFQKFWGGKARYSYSASQLNFMSLSELCCLPHQLFRIPLDFCLFPWFLVCFF